MTGLYAEPLPEGFGFSDTAFRVFILMASRRLKSDRFFTDDFKPEIYTEFGIDYLQTELDAARHPPALPAAGAGARRRDQRLRAVEDAHRSARSDEPLSGDRVMQRSLWIAGLLLVVALAARTTARGQSEPGSFPDIADHFKYGSVGTEERAGVPYWIWRVLPTVFADKLPTRPGKGYERIGFVYDGASHGRPDRHVLPFRPR